MFLRITQHVATDTGCPSSLQGHLGAPPRGGRPSGRSTPGAAGCRRAAVPHCRRWRRAPGRRACARRIAGAPQRHRTPGRAGLRRAGVGGSRNGHLRKCDRMRHRAPQARAARPPARHHAGRGRACLGSGRTRCQDGGRGSGRLGHGGRRHRRGARPGLGVPRRRRSVAPRRRRLAGAAGGVRRGVGYRRPGHRACRRHHAARRLAGRGPRVRAAERGGARGSEAPLAGTRAPGRADGSARPGRPRYTARGVVPRAVSARVSCASPRPSSPVERTGCWSGWGSTRHSPRPSS